MDCGSIIQVDCDGLHSYVNPCDLIEACLLHIPQQLSKQCIVDFFNTTIDTIPAWYFVRVNASHCLEAVPLVINDHDELVGCNATDTPGYLWAKIVWSTTAWWTVNVTVIWPMGNQQVQIGLTAAPGVIINPNLPACDDAILRGNMDWSTYRDCWSSGGDWYRAVRYATNDITPSLSTNLFRSYFFTNASTRWGSNLGIAPSMDIFRGNTDMEWVGIYDGMIRVPKTGMYDVWMKGECVINNWVSRVRLFLCKPGATNPRILMDAKYWAEDAFAWSYCNAPYQSAAGTAGLKSMTVTLTWHNLLYLEEDEYICMGCKVDSRETNWVTPDITWRHTVYELYDVGPWGISTEVPYTNPGLCFGMRRATAQFFTP